MEDHKAIQDELQYCEENKLRVTSVPTQNLRQLLDENQTLLKTLRFYERKYEEHIKLIEQLQADKAAVVEALRKAKR